MIDRDKRISIKIFQLFFCTFITEFSLSKTPPMTLLYVNEHLACYNYDKGNSPTMERKTLKKGDKWEYNTAKNVMLFVKKGEYILSYNKHKNKLVKASQIVLIPSETQVTSYAKEDSIIFFLRLGDVKNLCECFSLDMLLKEEDNEDDDLTKEPFFLKVNEKIITFFNTWDSYVTDGLMCRYFLQLKIKELFYLLRAYQTKEELLQFFYPVISNDMSFSDFVQLNYMKTKTVSELAQRANYSLSGFQKRFKKVFGVSAYNWMKDKKMNHIYHDITNSFKTFKEISAEYEFSSPSHFNDFCKSNFGHTPGELRKLKVNATINQ